MTDPVVRVTFKHEDEINGEPIGPFKAYRQSDLDAAAANGGFGVPYDPNREHKPWVTRSEARALAAEHSLALEEV